MDVCGLIFEKTENDSMLANDSVAELVIQDFFRQYGNEIDFNIESGSGMDKLKNFKNKFIYGSEKYIAPFFGILEKYNYNMRQEIAFAMSSLGLLAEPEKNSWLIELLLQSPVIQDISFDGESKFSIFSERYGDFSFELAYRYFKDNGLLRNYIKYSELPQYCHQHTCYVADIFPEMYSVSSLCQSYFQGHFYHSYTYDKENDVVIDLSSNAIMDKTQYYEIYKPQEISFVLNNELDYEIAIAEERSNQPYDRMRLPKLFLYKQYLESIGYKGEFIDAPYVKTK